MFIFLNKSTYLCPFLYVTNSLINREKSCPSVSSKVPDLSQTEDADTPEVKRLHDFVLSGLTCLLLLFCVMRNEPKLEMLEGWVSGTSQIYFHSCFRMGFFVECERYIYIYSNGARWCYELHQLQVAGISVNWTFTSAEHFLSEVVKP